jgi:ABC-type polysaccharide/polyol phosphate transport system ATPase subunit
MPNAIEVEDVSKRYRLGEYYPGRSLRESVTGFVHGMRRRGRDRRRDEIWSLRDVSLEVVEGQALGVIGPNGAGKTTLLKIVSRITEPTLGMSRTKGRVTSLLEVGTGFHPELTGRENVFLNGAILGMSRRDIDRRFDDIVSFAGVEPFIETPIKRYSSGMQLRLAFAVAAHLEPDIMVVDEVLAVGDAEFQAKCLGKMETVEREGRTVVFVSHNLDAIIHLCPQAVWLERGSLQALGPTPEVVDAYLGSQVQRSTIERLDQDPHAPVNLDAVFVTDHSGRRIDRLRQDLPFSIEVHISTRVVVPGLDISVQVFNMRGLELLNEAWSDTVSQRPNRPGEYVARLKIPPVLTSGEYIVGVWVGTRFDTFVHETIARRFRLEGGTRGRPNRAIALNLPWQVTRVDGHDEGFEATSDEDWDAHRQT